LTLTPGNTRVTATWAAPASDGNSAITGYKVQLNDETAIDKGASEFSHTFEGLSNGTQYTVKVWAVNTIGEGNYAQDTATPNAPAIAITAEGLDSLRVGQALNNARIVYTLTNGVFEDNIVAADFAITPAATIPGVVMGTPERFSATQVRVPVTGIPTTYNAGTVGINLPASIPATDNVVGETAAITPTGGPLNVGAVARGQLSAIIFTAGNKEYDGTAAATVTSTNPLPLTTAHGILEDHAGGVSARINSAAFADANAGTGITVNIVSWELEGVDANNYELPVTTPTAVADITPKELTITGFAVSRQFNGTNTIANSILGTLVFDGLVSPETATVNASGVTASFAGTNAGTHAVAFAGNFTMTAGTAVPGNYTITQPSGINGEITKADAPVIATQTVSVFRETATTGNIVELAGLLPANRGSAAYNVTSSNTLVTNATVTDAGRLTFNTLTTGAATNEYINISVSMQNYETVVIAVRVYFTDKHVPVVTATVTDGIEFGQTINDVKFTYSAVYNGTAVPGVFAWDNPGDQPPAGTATCYWTFTPANTTEFEIVNGNAAVPVARARPAGVPVFTAINAAGRTLADADLASPTDGFKNPHDSGKLVAGTLEWNLGDEHAVEANTNYGWTFTPDDAANYRDATGIILLYYVAPPQEEDSDSGDSGGNQGNQGNQGQQGQQGGGTGTAAPSQPLTTVDNTTTTLINNAVNTAITQAAGTGTAAVGTVTPRFENIGEISSSVLAAIDNAAGDMAVRIHFDTTLPGQNVVDVRVYINPSQVAAGSSINVSGSTTNTTAQAIGNTFERFFTNNIAVISLGQQGAFGSDVRVAARADLSGMADTDRLYFYSYDAATNTYTRIFNPQHRIDANGYLHFTTPLGGSIIVTDSPLNSRNAPAAQNQNQNNQGNQNDQGQNQNRQYQASGLSLYTEVIPQEATGVTVSAPVPAALISAIVELPVLTATAETTGGGSPVAIAVNAMLVMLIGAVIVWGVKPKKD
jgi:hypothetical protein